MMETKEVFSIPNMLSFLRILLIPFFIIAYIRAVNPKDYYFATAIIVLSGLTDFIDGFIARKFHMITDVGKVLDPIADKLTQTAILLALMFHIRFMIVVMIVFAVKEITMGIISFQLLKQGKKLDGALWFGKISTAVFYTMMVIIIAFPNLNIWITNLMITIILIFLLFSFAMYLQVLLKMKREHNS